MAHTHTFVVCIRYNIKENEAAIQSLTHDVRQTVEERNKLQSIVSQHQEIHKTVRLEGENKAAALEVSQTPSIHCTN